MRPKKNDLIYFAGLFDGEGCIHIQNSSTTAVSSQGKKRYYQHKLALSLGMTNEGMLRWIHSLFGGTITFHRPSGLGKRNLWYWSVTCARAEKILRLFLPYLRLKKPQGELALAFRKLFGKGMREHIPGGGTRLRQDVLKKRHKLAQQVAQLKLVG